MIEPCIPPDPEVAAAEAKLPEWEQRSIRNRRICGIQVPERCEICHALIVAIPDPTADQPDRIIPQAWQGVRFASNGIAEIYYRCLAHAETCSNYL